jgi:hypothetical protein
MKVIIIWYIVLCGPMSTDVSEEHITSRQNKQSKSNLLCNLQSVDQFTLVLGTPWPDFKLSFP